MPHFDGQTYDSQKDHGRLTGQLARVELFMRDGNWKTLDEIVEACGGTVASVSARVRDLRKEKFGAHTVERIRHSDGGLFLYRLVK
jgi:hypothetical protein